ncbi:hypothetical protein SG34_020165 [Thalassomonas viridans]|uniref:Uncharacterized protein n=1 Tax=Thalassomonas viridans TaxID=137584 RepID=A0AAE9Z0A4_9GAMM|nr:hypothetical protein [Thalassomonas viridans]WDE03679.1 hypothetical protein SG34_020165 [Thalassomonas viridans]
MSFATLNTNVVINFIRLTAVFLGVLVLTNIFTYVNFYGVEFIIFTILVVIIAWLNKVKYCRNFPFEGDIISVMVKVNIFGYSYVSISSKSLNQLNQVCTREKNYIFIDEKLKLSINIKQLNSADLPRCEVKKLA